jgi:uncharacterized protein (UPF0332 family)
MKPQSAGFINAARLSLEEAQLILAAGIPRQSARLAYVSTFHAAQALIFERTNQVAKTHRGVNALYSDQARADTALPTSPLATLYYFKDVADYDTGSALPTTHEAAVNACSVAAQFLSAIDSLLTSPPAP